MSINKETLKRIVIIAGVLLLLVILILVILGKKDNTPQVSTYKITTDEEDTPDTKVDSENTDIPSYDPSESLGFLKEHPWYRNLPIETEEYIITWNLDKDQFRIRLKIPENSSQEIKNSYTQRAVAALKEITGELFDKYIYYIMYQN